MEAHTSLLKHPVSLLMRQRGNIFTCFYCISLWEGKLSFSWTQNTSRIFTFLSALGLLHPRPSGKPFTHRHTTFLLLQAIGPPCSTQLRPSTNFSVISSQFFPEASGSLRLKMLVRGSHFLLLRGSAPP